jgi:hypothetical protein
MIKWLILICIFAAIRNSGPPQRLTKRAPDPKPEARPTISSHESTITRRRTLDDN